MTHEEIVAFQAKERAFLETPIGKTFHKFKNAYFAMAADQYNERASDFAIRKRDEVAKAAEREFREELAKLMEPPA